MAVFADLAAFPMYAYFVRVMCCLWCEHCACRYKELMADPAYVDTVLAQGADAANETAERTLAACKDAMGFVAPLRRQ